MKKFIRYIVPLLLVSCNKQELATSLSESDKVLNVDGFITNSNETQYIHFNLSSDLGDDNPDYLDDVAFQIVGEDETYFFTHDFQGRYKSLAPFSGVPGQEYEFQFVHDTEFYSAKTEMPFPMVVDSAFVVDSFYVGSTETYDSYLESVRLQIDSEREQYLGYDIYQMDTVSPFSGDTIWTEIVTPVFWVTPVQAAPNQSIRLPTDQSFERLVANKPIRIDVYSISKDVGDYLLELQNYMNSGQANSQFFNPPSFFSGMVYGLLYGRTETRVIFSI